MNLIAQTTQVTSGFASWGPAEWILIFGALGTLIGTLTTAIIAVLNAAKASKAASDAQAQASHATGVAEATRSQAQSTSDRVVDLATKMEPPTWTVKP